MQITDSYSFSKFYDCHKQLSTFSEDTKSIQNYLKSDISGKVKVSNNNYKLFSIMSIFLREGIVARNEDVTYSIIPEKFFEQLEMLTPKKRYFVLAYSGDGGNIVLDLQNFQVFLSYGDLYTNGYADNFIDSQNRFTCYLDLIEFVNDLIHLNVRSSYNSLTSNKMSSLAELGVFNNIYSNCRLATIHFDYSLISLHPANLKLFEFQIVSSLVFVDDILWDDQIQLYNLIDIESIKPSDLGILIAKNLSNGCEFYIKDSRIFTKTKDIVTFMNYTSLQNFYSHIFTLPPCLRGQRYEVSYLTENINNVNNDNPFE